MKRSKTRFSDEDLLSRNVSDQFLNQIHNPVVVSEEEKPIAVSENELEEDVSLSMENNFDGPPEHWLKLINSTSPGIDWKNFDSKTSLDNGFQFNHEEANMKIDKGHLKKGDIEKNALVYKSKRAVQSHLMNKEPKVKRISSEKINLDVEKLSRKLNKKAKLSEIDKKSHTDEGELISNLSDTEKKLSPISQTIIKNSKSLERTKRQSAPGFETHLDRDCLTSSTLNRQDNHVNEESELTSVPGFVSKSHELSKDTSTIKHKTDDIKESELKKIRSNEEWPNWDEIELLLQNQEEVQLSSIDVHSIEPAKSRSDVVDPNYALKNKFVNNSLGNVLPVNKKESSNSLRFPSVSKNVNKQESEKISANVLEFHDHWPVLMVEDISYDKSDVYSINKEELHLKKISEEQRGGLWNA